MNATELEANDRLMTDFETSGVPIAPVELQRWYAPRIWHGMTLGAWLRLLAENNFRFYYKRTALFLSVFPVSLVPTLSNPIQAALFKRKAERLPLVQDPIILIGHWRSGTTLLHELFGLDPRFRLPTTFECFNPLSFAISKHWMKPLTSGMLPPNRPMDNLRMDWSAPQEDEFAMLTMGQPTPYRRIAWPNSPPPYLNYLDMTDISDADLAKWKQALMTFVRYLNLFSHRRLVLKSPPHTGRMRVLLEMFPRARFVHITREPEKLIPSTIHLWAALDFANGLRRPNFDNLRDYVFTCFERMYAAYFRDEPLLNDRNLITIQFRELVSNTEPTMRRIYEQLELGDFSTVSRRVTEHMGGQRDYKPNRHPMVPDLQAEIDQKCAEYRERFLA